MPSIQSREFQEVPEVKPGCPLCGGNLYETRGSLRCARCSFVVCEGCGGDGAGEGGPGWLEETS